MADNFQRAAADGVALRRIIDELLEKYTQNSGHRTSDVDKSEYWFMIPFVIFVLILICIWVFT